MSPPSISWVLLMTLSGNIGCADDVSGADAALDGSTDTGPDGSMAITPPDIPWLSEGVPPIMLAPCPAGWREVLGGDVTECDPYPEGGAASCEAGDAHFPGEPGCRPIGDPCPAGDYATSLPESGPVVYVNASASTSGDGTVAAPFGALSEVPWVSLTASTTVAIGRGTYPGTLALKAGVSVVGACARDTILTGLMAPVPSVVSVTSAGEPATVENLTIRGAPQRGVSVRGTRALRLRGVLVERARGAGIVAADPGAEVTLTDVIVQQTEPGPASSSEAGIGIQVERGAVVQGTRVIIDQNSLFGVSAIAEGSQVTLTDVVVRDTRSRADGVGGRGINVMRSARVDATRLLVSGSEGTQLFAANVGSVLSITDSVVRRAEPEAPDDSGGLEGSGLTVQSGAELNATRVLVAAEREVGVFVGGAGSKAGLTDVVIRDTEPRGGEVSGGQGLSVQAGAHLDAVRLLVSDNTRLGMQISGLETVVTATDAVIQHTAASLGTGEAGRGFNVVFGARLEASRVLLDDNRQAGVVAAESDTVVQLSDVVVRNTRAQASDLEDGQGIHAQAGGRIDGNRIAIEDSISVGVVSLNHADIALSDVTIRGVEVSTCASTSCPAGHYGYGASAYSGSLSLTNFHVSGAAICGVMVAPASGSTGTPSLDLAGGVVAASPIGACVQVAGYDFGRLTNDVQYQDNDTNLDTTTLPVPGGVESLGP